MGSEVYLAKFREKVKGVLEKVQDLKEKLKEVEVPSSSGNCSKRKSEAQEKEKVLVQSEICGQFILLDWVFKWEEDKGKLKEEQTEAFEELKREVKLARIGANATRRDLKGLPILETGKKGTVGLEKKPEHESQAYFPRYLELPGPVVRKLVLDYLTSSEGKLNLIKAMPWEGELMGWKEKNLQVESVCRLLMKRGNLNMEDLYSLGKVNEELREAVKDHFENSLLEVDRSKRRKILLEKLIVNFPSDFTDEAMDNDENKKYLLNPFTAEIILDLDKGNASEEQMTLLGRFGPKIWNFTLKLKYGMSIPEKMRVISSCLHLMSNLRRFQVDAGSPFRFNNDENDEQRQADPYYLQKQWSLIDQMTLPDLPHLKALDVHGRCPGFEVVNRKLLDKYARQLHCLIDHYEYPMLDNLEENYKLICPRLSILKLDGGERDAEDSHCLEMNMGYLTMFQDSPLKTIVLDLPDINARARLPDLLILLSRQFGSTLESMSLFLCISSDTVELLETPPPTTQSTWFLDLKFPNMKAFLIDHIVQGDGLGYLLRFPALETLQFEAFQDVGGWLEELFENEPYLPLSADWDKMFASNVWKLFPCLNLYSLDNGTNTDMVEIKRKDCLWSQAHGNRAPPYLLSHPDADLEMDEENDMVWGSDDSDLDSWMDLDSDDDEFMHVLEGEEEEEENGVEQEGTEENNEEHDEDEVTGEEEEDAT